MFSPQQRMQELKTMTHGAVRLKAVSQAVKEADDQNQHEWRLRFRYEYIAESAILGDNLKGLLCFAEYLRIFETHSELENTMYQDMMQIFKWVISNIKEYYQISLEEVQQYFEKFKKYSQKYGFSLRTYYMKQTDFWINSNPDLADVAYANFLHYPRSENSDCEACELHFKMKILLSKKDENKALEIIRPVLEHEKKCAEIPHLTYAELAYYYFLQQNFSESVYYVSLCEPLVTGKPEFLAEIGLLLEICSRTDVSRGWKLFKYHLEYFMHCLNPVMKMQFARGAWRLMQKLSEKQEFVYSPLLGVLPVAPDGERWNIEKISDFFYEIAHDISQKLDNRNQTEYYQKIVTQNLPEYDEQKAIQDAHASVHGLVRKTQTVIAVFLKNKITEEQLKQRIQNTNNVISCSHDAHGFYISLQTNENPLDIAIAVNFPAPPAENIQGMEQEEIQNLLASPQCCVLASELSGSPQKSYHAIMKYLSALFPDMNGIINTTARKAYPSGWVHFAGKYLSAVSPHDLYSVCLSGSEETGKVIGTTAGLTAFGLRELGFIQANAENFGNFAAFLDSTAAVCIENNFLPDEKQDIAFCYDADGQKYSIHWKAPSGVLNLHELPELLEFETSEKNFSRQTQLAEETLPLFQKALQKPFIKALVRINVSLDRDIQPLWAEVMPDGTSILLETSEIAPEFQAGNVIETEISDETIYDWRIQPVGTDGMISPEEAYLLQEE